MNMPRRTAAAPTSPVTVAATSHIMAVEVAPPTAISVTSLAVVRPLTQTASSLPRAYQTKRRHAVRLGVCSAGRGHNAGAHDAAEAGGTPEGQCGAVGKIAGYWYSSIGGQAHTTWRSP